MLDVKEAACIGGGVIGAAWAARFAAAGIDVAIVDPDPEAERKVAEVFANAERAQAKLTLAPIGRRGKVRVVQDLSDAVSNVDFIQEAAPERLEFKQNLFTEIEKHARPDTIIASSTSGFKPSDLQRDMAHPERLLVGHPFNPVYLLPLVEIVGGAKTSARSLDAASDFYTSLGMHPLRVRKEIDAHIADRLMEALWREALWLVNDDIATAEEVDDAIRYGCGLRWAQMGTFQVFNIAGGEAGMRHFMAQFGPALKWPWTKLMDTPELTDALVDKIAAQCEVQSAGYSIRELERIRDDNLIAIMQALKANKWGAGKTLSDYESRLYASAHASSSLNDHDLSKPIRIYEAVVQPDWTDYNNHMNEARYLQVFCDATDRLLQMIGVDADYVAGGNSYYTVETHLCHIREVAALEPLVVTFQMLSHDEKRIHHYQEIRHARSGDLLASAEQMLLHVDAKASKACPAKPQVLERVERIAAGHKGLPAPERVGRSIGSGRAK